MFYNSDCRPGNEPMMSKDFWVFETLDVTPPTVNFVSAAERYSENVTVTWGINEENVTVLVDVKQVDTNTTVMGEIIITERYISELGSRYPHRKYPWRI